MAFCGNCGSEVQGRFCAQCGAPVAGDSTPPQQPPQQPEPPRDYPTVPAPYTQPAGLDENLACALCYLLGLLTGILFLVLEPYSRNRLIRFHAFQSIFLNLAWVAVLVVISIISMVLLPIPFLGPMLSVMLNLAAGLGILILWLMLMYKAYNKERWVLPVIGPMAEKQV